INNQVLVTGPGSIFNLSNVALDIGLSQFGSTATGNWLQVEAGGVVTNVGLLKVGNYDGNAVGASAGNWLLVTGGGQVFAASLIAGAGNAVNNSVLVTPGSVLEANTLSNHFGGTGNTISNVAGIYQFTTATPTIGGPVAVTGGTISFRAISNANVRA